MIGTQRIAPLERLGYDHRGEKDDVEFEEFTQAELPALTRYAMVLCGHRQLAEDVLQEVLARALAIWPRVAAAAAPGAYVRRMVTNEFLSFHRKWHRMVPTAEVPVVGTAPDPADATADQLLMIEHLGRLPKRQRAVLTLRYYGGLSDAEIAAELGCTTGTVRGHASRALATLRIGLHPEPCLIIAEDDRAH